MFNIFDRRVHVTFINDATGQWIGKSRLAVSDLPDSFLESTTLEIGDKTWAVVCAEPPFKRLFANTKKLSVRLTPIEQLDTQKLLYSLPTIADGLPTSDGPMADGSEAAMLEDDWRQIECVSNQFISEIHQEIADIEAIHHGSSQEVGFTEIHVRARISDPLSGSAIRIADIEDGFGAASTTLRFHDHGQRISNAFCYDLGGNWLLYGIRIEDRPAVLAVAPSADTQDAPAPHLCESLNDLCGEHSLLLVDWCRCRLAEPGSVEFAAIFAPHPE